MKMMGRSMMSIAAAIMFGTSGLAMAAYDEQDERRLETDDALPQVEQEEQVEPTVEELVLDEDTQEGQLLATSDVPGYEVRDQQGEKIGTVSELAIDTRHGQIAYGILDLDEPLALEGGQNAEDGEHEASQFAVPWPAFAVVPDGDALELTIDRPQLAQGDPFDAQWEQLSEKQWASRQHEAYGVSPYWEQHGERDIGIRQEHDEEDLMQADINAEGARDAVVHAEAEAEIHVEALSDVIGRTVHARQDEGLAKVDDFMIDTREGRLAYAILSYGGMLGIGADLVAVPYQALRPMGDAFVLDADRETLDRLAFEGGERPDMTDPQWTEQVHDAFDQEPYWQVFGYAPPSKMAGEQEEEDTHEADQLQEQPEQIEDELE